MSSHVAADHARAATGTTTDLAIRVERVSVSYHVPRAQPSTFKEYALGRLRAVRTGSFEHKALDDVTVEISRGEAVGIIGANGSGKTTLLRLVARVMAPTAGRVRTYGRVAPILDIMGALHPELTGRENIFLNGTLFGLTRRDIIRRFDRIVEFAELGPFIDAPVRTYSSGMMARLGFAVASDTDPDILLIDEAIGVGDERFQRKCAARLESIRSRGATFVLVSHDLGSVLRLCSRAVWLDKGRVQASGPASEVVSVYAAR